MHQPTALQLELVKDECLASVVLEVRVVLIAQLLRSGASSALLPGTVVLPARGHRLHRRLRTRVRNEPAVVVLRGEHDTAVGKRATTDNLHGPDGGRTRVYSTPSTQVDLRYSSLSTQIDRWSIELVAMGAIGDAMAIRGCHGDVRAIATGLTLDAGQLDGPFGPHDVSPA